MSKETFWNTLRKPGELLFKTTLKQQYKQVWLLGSENLKKQAVA